MMETHNGEHLVITHGSDGAASLCGKILAQVANYFAGEDFQISDADRVDREATIHYSDDQAVHIAFAAFKTHMREDGDGMHVNYVVHALQQRPWEDGEYWPPCDEEDEDDDIEEETESGLLLDDEDDDWDDEEDWEFQDGFSEKDFRTVSEGVEFHLDDEHLRPFKETYYVYRSPGTHEMIRVQKESVAEDPETTEPQLFDDDPDTDIALTIHDSCLTQSFSEYDVVQMMGILKKLGFTSLTG